MFFGVNRNGSTFYRYIIEIDYHLGDYFFLWKHYACYSENHLNQEAQLSSVTVWLREKLIDKVSQQR